MGNTNQRRTPPSVDGSHTGTGQDEATLMGAWACSHCGATTGWRFLYRMRWDNGVLMMDRLYCPKCVRNGYSPPLKQARIEGTVTKLWLVRGHN